MTEKSDLPHEEKGKIAANIGLKGGLRIFLEVHDQERLSHFRRSRGGRQVSGYGHIEMCTISAFIGVSGCLSATRNEDVEKTEQHCMYVCTHGLEVESNSPPKTR